ncbi:MAG: LLM class flavin-dependent oxidoreductase [Chloroflexi bacterium]|nr:LLM class flavin-dependent oxidoreductase [Chloroflexota bacterium]
MDIGIGLPAHLPGVSGPALLDWARLAEELGFTSLATIDRLVYGNLDPLIALAAVAPVTQKARLTTAILITPTRNTAVLAKQAASIDALSQGRLVLGIGLGGRNDDYEAAGQSTKQRGRRMGEQIQEMHRIWAGEPRGFAGPIGPPPARSGGPELLIGGQNDLAVRRGAELTDGRISGPSGADRFKEASAVFLEAWRSAGRRGTPRQTSIYWYALGSEGRKQADDFLLDYYKIAGPRAEQNARAAATDQETIRRHVAEYRAAGCDELIFIPCAAGIEQVELLKQAVA